MTAGPALGIAPVWAVAAVCTAYPVGPASTAISATPAATSPNRPADRPASSSATTAPVPSTATATRSQGCQSALRLSSVHDQAVLTATVAASSILTHSRWRRCHRVAAPMPTSAPTAGARATV